jgi:hypothetical protein
MISCVGPPGVALEEAGAESLAVKVMTKGAGLPGGTHGEARVESLGAGCWEP